MKKSQLKKIIKEEISRVINEQSEIDKAKQEIDNAKIDQLWVQPSSWPPKNDDKDMAIKTIIKRLKEMMPTLIKLKPDLISSTASPALMNRNGENIQGIILGTLNPYMGFRTNNGVINVEKAKESLKRLINTL